ncbi:MAG: FAD-dependent oxidoreductase [Anaerolineae bacterium]
MTATAGDATFDYIVIGSGFGGSVSAMRLTEKGYRVLVLEQGKRYRDEDFATTNWQIWKYLWLPPLRCFGILELTPFRNVVVLHGNGVGGGSLGYANVLTEPDPKLFDAPTWRHLADWQRILRPHYETAKRMLGVSTNPCLWPADHIMKEIATEMGRPEDWHPTSVGVFFGPEGIEAPDPYFGGQGPARRGCTHCGACMVGCRYNAKNTLVKNYLYFAEKWGAEIRAEAQVTDIRPLGDHQPDGARYEVIYRKTTNPLAPRRSVRARNVIVAAGVIGTLRLLFRCRDITRTLPHISPQLGDMVRTNNESLTGVVDRDAEFDFSKGIAITSIFRADEVTHVEPVRYPAGSSLMRFLAGPMIEADRSVPERFAKVLGKTFRHPADSFRLALKPGWANRTTILLVMQTENAHMKVRLGRHLLTLGRRDLVSQPADDQQKIGQIPLAHELTYAFARKTKGVPAASVTESLFNVPITAHILGGVPMGLNAEEGVIGLDCQVHNYPGLYVVDNSIIPANPGVNPSLTTTALAEYAMSLVPPQPGHETRGV